MHARFITVLLLATALAGCGGDPSAAPAPAADVPESVSSSTCSIRGVVIDDAIVPVEGVLIRVVGQKFTTQSDAKGGFSLCDLPEGTYFLEASKAGYKTTQTSVDLTGVAAPPILRIVIERIPGREPYIVPMQWDGFMACSWFVGTFFATGCLIGEYIEDNSRRFDQPDARPHHLQSELSWDHTQPAGQNLCMRHYASSGIGGDTLGDVCGPSPLIFTSDAAQIEQTGVGNTRGIERVVWVDFWLAENTAGIAIDQSFTVFTHLFFNFLPADDWSFLQDGAHPVPPA